MKPIVLWRGMDYAGFMALPGRCPRTRKQAREQASRQAAHRLNEERGERLRHYGGKASTQRLARDTPARKERDDRRALSMMSCFSLDLSRFMKKRV